MKFLKANGAISGQPVYIDVYEIKLVEFKSPTEAMITFELGNTTQYSTVKITPEEWENACEQSKSRWD